ncbi:hypothetical protein [Streptomyces sp. NPDC046985]|uniref:hypothetical protein n=1 Tax=Streptomyces sp. NPDC046985 TaxID=3155377 RepID=UPI0033E506B9
MLRQTRTTALAVDDQLAAVHGFTLTDALELVLQYTDHAVQALAPAWPRPAADELADRFACDVVPAEVDAARAPPTWDRRRWPTGAGMRSEPSGPLTG